MNHLHIVLAFISLVGISTCGLVSGLMTIEMVNEVNEKLREEERFFEAFWYWGKYRRLLSEHARLYPNSNLRRVYLALVVAFFACLVTLALTIFRV